jgi:energy-converting hydrogenase Eha subunit B
MAAKRARTGDIMLAVVGVVLGAIVAGGYGAWRAVSETDASAGDRWSSFGGAMLFPGSLVIVVVAVIVWLGWKANIDG